MFNENEFIGETQQINDKIDGIKSSFLSLLNDYKKYYVFYNSNPDVEEYQQSYSQTKNQLTKLSKELSDIIFVIYNKINNLNNESKSLYDNLDKNKVDNKLLNKKIQNLQGINKGSKILINDFKNKYDEQFYMNMELFLGILLVGGILKITFT